MNIEEETLTNLTMMLIAFSLAVCASLVSAQVDEVPTIDDIDITKYVGRFYQVFLFRL